MKSCSRISEAISRRESLTQHASRLRADGYDAIAVLEVGLSGAPDERVLRFAVENGRVLLTLDADFANIMRFPPEQTLGVVRLRIHPATEEKIDKAIKRSLLFLRNVDMVGRLAVVDEDKIRIRR